VAQRPDSVAVGTAFRPVTAWSLPARYPRSPVETIALRDVAALTEWLVAFLGSGR
jgi:putative aminopeptidase FrvX